MKKIFLLAAFLIFGATNAFANCDIAGYDEKGLALYYDDCKPDVGLIDRVTIDQPTYADRYVTDPLTPSIDRTDPVVIPVANACDGVICPSGMACSDGCCLLK